jgi:hypothetical protein
MTGGTGPGRTARSAGRRLAFVAVVAVAAVGTYAFAAPFGPSEPAYGATILVRALGCGLIGLVAGTLSALASIDPERTGSGLFLALGGVVASVVGLSIAYPDDRYLPLVVITIYTGPLVIGYLIAAALADDAAADGAGHG